MAKQRINFTKEQQEDVVTMYLAGKTYNEIMAKHDINAPSTVKRLLSEHGIAPNRKTVKKAKKCACGNVNPTNAKYCFMCGEYLQSPEEAIIENLLCARVKAVQYAPAHMQKEIDEQIMAAVELLRIKCEVAK